MHLSSSNPHPATPQQTAGADVPLPADTIAELAALAPLTEELSRSVTCPICLEHMLDARQLQCGHLFCSECVVRMLGMRRVRCAICKEKTGKRMVRDAPLPFADIVRQLKILDGIVEECAPPPKRDSVSLNDGFQAVLQTTLARIQNAPSAAASRVQDELECVTPSKSECALCPRVLDLKDSQKDVSFGELMPTVSQRMRNSLMVHEQCALYSLDVYQVGERFENVQLMLNRSSDWVCARKGCGQRRPNLTCAFEKCSVRFHYACAVLDDCVLVEDGFKMFCPLHKKHAPTINEKEFGDNLCDANNAIAKQHADSCYKCGTGGRLLMCDTCDRVTHPACSGLRAIPIGDWSCRVCTGLDVVPKDPPSNVQPASDSKARAGKRQSSGVKRRRSDSMVVQGSAGYDEKRSQDEKSTVSKRPRRSLEGTKRYVLSHTGLSEPQRDLIKGVSKARKTSIRSDLDGRVTHMVISAYTRNDTPGRTMKLCKAIASKKPILCWKWIEDSAEQKGWANMEEYIHPLTWPENEEGVFHGLRFYFGALNGARDKKEELQTLVRMGGGTVVQRDPSLDMARHEGSLMFIRDEEVKKATRRELLSRYEPPAGATVVPSVWILDKCTNDRSI